MYSLPSLRNGYTQRYRTPSMRPDSFNMQTHRQRILDLLSENRYTLQELSSEMGISMKELLHHLDHARKSVRSPRKFVLEPARCIHCGFVFKDRRKLHSPSKCPRCRSTHIEEPVYGIE